MAQEYKEFRQKTVEDAITEACQSFMVTSDRLDYVVVDEGSRGFLGINARDAVIKARVKGEVVDDFSIEAGQIKAVLTEDRTFSSVFKEKEEKEAGQKAEKPERSERSEKSEKPEKPARSGKANRSEKEEKNKEEKPEMNGQNADAEGENAVSSEEKPAHKHSRSRNRNRKKENQQADESVKTASAAVSEQAAEGAARKSRRHDEKPLTDEQIAAVKEQADLFLHQVFNAMGMDVDIDLTYEKEGNILTISFLGDDMGVLIGKRGQTLDSLQYLVSLVINKGLDSYVHVKADTENYRERRKRTLENLAKNMAAKVKRTRKAVSLEPMNPYERRIIHAALQGDRYVTTYSEGQEPFRKVVVTPKKTADKENRL